MFQSLKTGVMSQTPTRSEEVVESFKQRKLAQSAMRRIHELIREFEQDRIADRRWARVGIALILLVLGISMFFFLGGDSVILN